MLSKKSLLEISDRFKGSFSLKLYKLFFLFFKFVIYKNRNFNNNFFYFNSLAFKESFKLTPFFINYYYYFVFLLLYCKKSSLSFYIFFTLSYDRLFFVDYRVFYFIYVYLYSISIFKFNYKLFFVDKPLKVYFFKEFILRIGLDDWVHNTKYVSHLRRFKYNEYLNFHPSLLKYSKLRWVLHKSCFYNFYDYIKYYRRTLSTSCFDFYYIALTDSPKVFVNLTPNYFNFDKNSFFIKYLYLVKDKSFFRLVLHFFFFQFNLFGIFLVYKYVNLGLLERYHIRMRVINLAQMMYLVESAKLKYFLLIFNDFFFVKLNYIFYNTFTDIFLFSDLDNFLISNFFNDFGYWYRIYSFIFMKRLYKFFFRYLRHWDYNYFYKNRNSLIFVDVDFLYLIWDILLSHVTFTFEIPDYIIYNHYDKFLNYLNTYKDNMDYIVYCIFFANYDILGFDFNIISERIYIDRIINDNFSLLSNYYFRFLSHYFNLNDSFLWKLCIFFLIYDFYVKVINLFYLNNMDFYNALNLNYYHYFLVYKHSFFNLFILQWLNFHSYIYFFYFYLLFFFFYYEYDYKCDKFYFIRYKNNLVYNKRFIEKQDKNSKESIRLTTKTSSIINFLEVRNKNKIFHND